MIIALRGMERGLPHLLPQIQLLRVVVVEPLIKCIYIKALEDEVLNLQTRRAWARLVAPDAIKPKRSGPTSSNLYVMLIGLTKTGERLLHTTSVRPSSRTTPSASR
jgi:hypothetical protein